MISKYVKKLGLNEDDNDKDVEFSVSSESAFLLISEDEQDFSYCDEYYQ